MEINITISITITFRVTNVLSKQFAKFKTIVVSTAFLSIHTLSYSCINSEHHTLLTLTARHSLLNPLPNFS